MKITINEPCHENWDAMTPNTQGAFCKSCAKDVVDFSKMGIEEIKSFFSKPKSDKVCGRFEEKQLQELSFDDFFAKFTYWNFAKKFAVIFFMVFGFWVFSNSSAIAQNDRHMMKGEVMYVPEKTPKKDSIKKHTPPPIEDKKYLLGKISRREQICEPEITKTEPITKGNDIIEEPQMLMGSVVAMPQKEKPKEICKPEEIIQKDTIITQLTDESENNQITGLIAIEDFVDKTEIMVIESVIKGDSIASGVERIANNTTQINIYPNPSNGNFVIETNLDTKQTVHIYDENGKVVLTQNINGTSTINASSLNEGIYTVSLTNNEGIVNKRVVIVK